MNSLVHQSSYPIYISYSSAISGFQSENIRDVGIDFFPKTDQKETVANFNLIRLPRHRLSQTFFFAVSFQRISTYPTSDWTPAYGDLDVPLSQKSSNSSTS